jgi:Icc-related predicted phosphoesterase
MKLLAIGDAHGNLEKIKEISLKDVDLILLTGDLGKADLARKKFFENIERKKQGLPELEETLKDAKAMHYEIHNSTIALLKYLSKHARVYAIEGNVGIPIKSEVKKLNKNFGINLPCTMDKISLMNKVNIVKNRLRVFDGLRVGFLDYFMDVSWMKDFKPSDYKKRMKNAKKDTEKARKVLKRFGKLDILVCHQPPYGILDRVSFLGAPKHWQGKHAGSKAILEYIKKYQPKYVFCGHIHESKGMKKIGRTEVYNLGVAGWKAVEL